MRTAILLLMLAMAASPAQAAGAVRSADGVPIAYTVQGRGTPALVFVHCWACDHTFWDAQVAHFARTHQVVTLDLGGQARFGPDAQWLDVDRPEDIDYAVDPARAEAFYDDVRRYWPALPDGALQPAYSGVRPKLGGPEAPSQDFRIDGPAQHGWPGLVHLLGIESPGLTSCLAIADEAVARLRAAGSD